MATSITTTMKVVVSGSGTSSATETRTVEAYGKIEVTVPAAAGGADGMATLQVQPGGAGQVELVFITADAYPEAADGAGQLTYSVDAGMDRTLNAPLLLVGTGAVALLGDINEIVFTNASDEAVEVEILIGRDATP